MLKTIYLPIKKHLQKIRGWFMYNMYSFFSSFLKFILKTMCEYMFLG